MDGGNCDLDVNECESRPCQNGAICVDSTSDATVGIAQYRCLCLPGFAYGVCNYAVIQPYATHCATMDEDDDDVNDAVLTGNCNIDVNECSSNPCQNGATCMETVPNEFACSCVIGWAGSKCDLDVDECASAPCKNGAACTDSLVNVELSVGGYRCICVAGFAGGMCSYPSTISYRNGSRVNCTIGLSTDLDIEIGDGNCQLTVECSSIPCHNNARCSDSNSDSSIDAGTYQCACVHGYASGESGNCDIDVDECASAPCQNGAACADSTTNSSVPTGGYRCSCVDGYTSGTCEYSPVVEAYADSCAIALSSGVSSPGDGNCAVDVDECASHPCQNGGMCKESFSGGLPAGTYTCVCQSGFGNGECDYTYITEYADECTAMDGGNCDLDVNECESHPCQNGAICVDSTSDATVGIAQYRCLCDAMLWSGKQCEIDRHEVCSHVSARRSNVTFHLCAGSCVLETECNSCSLVHERMVNCGGSCAPITCPPALHPCSSRPCFNGGSCNASLDSFDRFGRFNCSCPAGFAGLQCEYNVDECTSEPCRNGGTCLDGIDVFACQCPPGFSGPKCALDNLAGHVDRECGPVAFFGKIPCFACIHGNSGPCRCLSLQSDRQSVEQVVVMDTRVNQLSACTE
jgi:Notch-like protein